MKKIATIISISIASISSGQQYLGVQTWGGTGSDQLNALALDEQDRIFALGGFRNTTDMDPGPGDWPLTAVAGQDIFLSRFTADAVFEWSVALGGSGHDHAAGLAIHSGGVYVGGEFAGTLEADGVTLISGGGSDALLAKFTHEGALLWAISAGSTGSDYINDIAVDGNGNVVAIGYFQGTVDFDPGPGVFPVAAGGTDAMFLWKLSPAGELMDVRVWNGTSSENGNAVVIGAANDVWIGGGFYGTLDFDPGPGTTSFTAPGFDQNAFLIHLDADLNYIWGGHMGGNGTDVIEDLALAANGDVIAIGRFSADGDFDPGPGVTTLTNLGGPDSFVLRFAATGDLVWALSFGSTAYDVPNAVVMGTSGEIHVCGAFDGTIDLDPGTGVANFISNGSGDVYVLTLDGNGQYLEGASWGGTGFDNGSAVAWSPQDRKFAGGFFEYNVDFDPGPGSDPVQSNLNSRDAFMSRLCTPVSMEQDLVILEGDSAFLAGVWQHESGEYTDVHTAVSGCDSVIVTNLIVEIATGVDVLDDVRHMRLYPIPARDHITIQLQQPVPGGAIEILDRMGRRVRIVQLGGNAEQMVDLAGLSPGIYTARIAGEPGIGMSFVKE